MSKVGCACILAWEIFQVWTQTSDGKLPFSDVLYAALKEERAGRRERMADFLGTTTYDLEAIPPPVLNMRLRPMVGANPGAT